MRKPTVAIAAAIALIAGQAIAGSTLKAGDRIAPTRANASADSEDYVGLTATQIVLSIAGIAAAVLVIHEIADDDDDGPDSP